MLINYQNAHQEYVFMYFVRSVAHLKFYSYVDYIETVYTYMYIHINIYIYNIKDADQE